jgi:hypothetical protein
MWWPVHHELGVSFLAKKFVVPPETEKKNRSEKGGTDKKKVRNNLNFKF